MKTLQGIKEGMILTDSIGDEILVDTIGTVEINDEYIEVYVMKGVDVDWTATYTLEELEEYEYYIKEESEECCDEEECECYEDGYAIGFKDGLNEAYDVGYNQCRDEILEQLK